MHPWQVVLASVGTILAGVFIGVFVGYLLFRFLYNYPITLASTFRILIGKRPKSASSSDLASLSDNKHEILLPIEVQLTPPQVVRESAKVLPPAEDRGGESMLRLLAEFERNCTTAREFSGDNLVPLQTEVWDSSQNMLRKLHADLRDDLEHIYADIRLLNHLAWFSSEFHSQSHDLHEQYARLLMSIANRLDKIIRIWPSYFTSEGMSR
jgi:hypothetical protein